MPLPGANVFVPELSLGTSTDMDGFYSLNLAGEARTLRVELIGFQGISTALISDRIDFILGDAGISLDEVVVESREAMELGGFMDMAPPPAEPEMDYVAVQTRSNTTTTAFEIEVPYTIASDAEPSLVDIAQHEAEATYEYYVAPALRQDAFLTARMTNWEALNLLSGPANLFFDETFVGETYLDIENVSDTLDLSLGIDQGIVVHRKRMAEFSKKQFLGGRRTDVSAYEIEIRNAKTIPVSIVIEDQIPLSSMSDIDVSLEDAGSAQYIEETGMLRWAVEIPPSTTETMQFRYTIRYPKDRNIVIR